MIWLGRGDEKRSVLTWKHGDDYCLIGAISARKSANIDCYNVSQCESKEQNNEVSRQQDEQNGDDWAVLKRYGWSNVHLIVHFYANINYSILLKE